MSAEWIVRVAFAGFAVCAAAVATAPNAWLACAALLLGGACWVLALSLFNVTVQLSTPRWVVGRALALYQTATFGGMALGSWVWGVAAEGYSAEQALLAAAAVMIARRTARARACRCRRRRRSISTRSTAGTSRHLALDLKPRSGPIVIMIEYIIREEDTRRFPRRHGRAPAGPRAATARATGR